MAANLPAAKPDRHLYVGVLRKYTQALAKEGEVWLYLVSFDLKTPNTDKNNIAQENVPPGVLH